MEHWLKIYYPIYEVLKNSGSISIALLVKTLKAKAPHAFKNKSEIEEIIDNSTACLSYDGEKVFYMPNSFNYTGSTQYERIIQENLHKNIPFMNEYQLYEFKTKDNSEKCYVGVPWGDIPKFDEEEQNSCDYRCKGKKTCRMGCGVTREILEIDGIFNEFHEEELEEKGFFELGEREDDDTELEGTI